jgi:hypothetical protein
MYYALFIGWDDGDGDDGEGDDGDGMMLSDSAAPVRIGGENP